MLVQSFRDIAAERNESVMIISHQERIMQLADDIPEDDDVHRYCLRIGEVKEQNEFFSISQIWQYGDVEIRGRYVE